ncbi:MAG: hypothetical protein RPS47_05160 [Colwellia sp.]|jgi:hypothetical protein
MLNAIIHGKAGRVNEGTGEESISWKQLYQKREDLLTASFFSRFSYLSPVNQHRILKHCFSDQGDFTEFEGIDYWPKYDLPEHENRKFVEPDLLIKFKGFDLLVEVKPPQGGDQYIDQWQLEIEGYLAQEIKTKPLKFLAIGRINKVSDAEISELKLKVNNENFMLASVKWKQLAVFIYNLHQLRTVDVQDKRVLDDMLKSLSLYGIRGHDLYWSDMATYSNGNNMQLEVMASWTK